MVQKVKILLCVMAVTLTLTVMFEMYVSKESFMAAYIANNNMTSPLSKPYPTSNFQEYKELTVTTNYTLSLVTRPWNQYVETNRLHLNQEENSIAIGGALRLSPCFRGRNEVFLRQSLFRELLPTFCKTVSTKFVYYFIFVHDHNDPCLSDKNMKQQVQELFDQQVKKLCPANVVKGLELIKCDYTAKPARAQNDAMMAAYWKNITYFYRLNDDTLLQTGHWADYFVSALKRFDPSNLGVTGPRHSGGNMRILTYDFTHRTHIDIHGFYYPRHFTDWFADAWITETYKKIGRMAKVIRVQVKHTMRKGRRYRVQWGRSKGKELLVNKSAELLLQWKDFIADECGHDCLPYHDVDDLNVCSFALIYNKDEHVTGALRNVLLAKKLLPNWTIRVYVSSNLPEMTYHVLASYGAQIILVNETEVTIKPIYLAYLVADDPNVTRFIVRNVTHRLSPRQTHLINDWQLSDHAYHTIRDRPWHSDMALVPDLFGAVREHLYHRLNTSMFDIILAATQEERIDDVSGLLNDVIWPVIKEDVLSHDSVAADKWTGSVPFNKTHFDTMKIGQPTSQHEQEFDGDVTEIKDEDKYDAPKKDKGAKPHYGKFHKRRSTS